MYSILVISGLAMIHLFRELNTTSYSTVLMIR